MTLKLKCDIIIYSIVRNCGNDERKSMAEEILDKNVNTVEVDEPEISSEIKDIEDNTQVEHATRCR